ncbi:nucleotidyltransferase family protein [Rhabdothermincola sediminis]|uniref:nucleotidyltransferase family protein n=1 Tax=Rhabdothermincola sediminis TaxID=2751370 RepID=UPI001AA0A245|nr:nucleotidyltransferase family protein [Rhabdothermincola sediminis]
MTAPASGTVVAVVLAAGGGSRFAGSDSKLLAPFQGRPLVTWAIDAALRAGIGEVMVVEGPIDLGGVLPAGVTRVRNERWKDGMATSLGSALEAVRGWDVAAIVVGLGDQPRVPLTAWRAVARCTDRPIAVATYGGRRGHPVRLAREIWDLLPVSGDEGARVLMRARPELVTEVACVGDPSDVDTLEDLSRWS